MSEREMWEKKWETGEIGFHRTQLHPDLVNYAQQFVGDKTHRILVPLCGKSLDLPHLVARGHEVVGVEIVRQPIEELFAEHGAEPDIDRIGPYERFRAGALTVLWGDFFELEPVHIGGGVDRVWDRAALVALRQDLRRDYTQRLRSFLRGDWRILQNTVEYDQSVMKGPPWSVSEEDVRALYGDCEIEVLHTRDVIADVDWKERGHDYWISSTYLIGPHSQ